MPALAHRVGELRAELRDPAAIRRPRADENQLEFRHVGKD